MERTKFAGKTITVKYKLHSYEGGRTPLYWVCATLKTVIVQYTLGLGLSDATCRLRRRSCP